MNKQHERLLPFLVFSFSFVLLFAYSATSIQAASPQSVTTSITGNTVTGNVSTQIVPPQVGGKIYGIQGGQTVGKNLFHSFGQFNVGAGDTAQFQTSNLTQNAAISNILGRINGQQSASQILGTINSATFYPSANLFLMNPYGFLFGPNASVNVGGMVAFTSADYLRLEGAGGNGTFYADAAKGSILTSSPVAAFGFLGSNPGAITVQGSQLSVTPGQSLSLVGGNITVQSGTLDNGTVQTARLSAPGGRINVAGVASPGELSAVDFAPLSSMTMGNISLSQGATLETSANTAGPIVIRGGQLMMDDASIKAISMDGLGGGNDAPNISPKISITAETVSLANGALITADSYGTAAAGDITLNVDTLTTQAGVNRLPLNPPLSTLISLVTSLRATAEARMPEPVLLGTSPSKVSVDLEQRRQASS